jgi:hypothetical protein
MSKCRRYGVDCVTEQCRCDGRCFIGRLWFRPRVNVTTAGVRISPVRLLAQAAKQARLIPSETRLLSARPAPTTWATDKAYAYRNNLDVGFMRHWRSSIRARDPDLDVRSGIVRGHGLSPLRLIDDISPIAVVIGLTLTPARQVAVSFFLTPGLAA